MADGFGKFINLKSECPLLCPPWPALPPNLSSAGVTLTKIALHAEERSPFDIIVRVAKLSKMNLNSLIHTIFIKTIDCDRYHLQTE